MCVELGGVGERGDDVRDWFPDAYPCLDKILQTCAVFSHQLKLMLHP